MTYKDEVKKTAEERGVTQKEVEAGFEDWLKTSLSDLWKAVARP